MKKRAIRNSSVSRSPILRWSIGAKLVIAFLALSIIPLVATAYYNLIHSKNEIIRVTKKNLMELSRSTANNIEQVLGANQRTSLTLANESSVVQFLSASQEEREALTPQVYQTLQNYDDTHPEYTAPGLLNTNGIVVAAVLSQADIDLAGSPVGKDLHYRDFFKHSIQGESYISGIRFALDVPRPSVFLSEPVVTAEEEIVGISIVLLEVDTIWDIIDNVVAGEKGGAFLVDKDGVIIGHPNRGLLYHSLGELTPETVAEINETIRFGTVEGTDTPFIPKSLGMNELAATLASSKGSATSRYYSPLDHSYHTIGYTRLSPYSWTVVVDVPEAQFLAPVRQLEATTWLIVSLVATLVLLISIMLARGITRPIRRLTDAATAVEQGKTFEPSDIEDVTSGHDESAKLARVFNSMVLAIRHELAERKHAEEALQINRERLRTANSILRHDVTNDIVVIKSALDIYRNENDETMLDEIEKRIDKSISTIRKQREQEDFIDSHAGLDEYDMEKVANDVIKNYHDIKINITGTGTAYADNAIYSVFDNIISNAIKHGKTTKMDINIRSYEDYCEIRLVDYGIGIPDKIKNEIFDEGFQYGKTGHTGIGLYIVQKTIDEYDGFVTVEDNKPHGAVFVIRLKKIIER